jgi:hypothetical protein
MFSRDHGARIARASGIKRSPQWKAARRAHLERQPWCVSCRKQYTGFLAVIMRFFRGVVVHHIYPFHVVRVLNRGDLEFNSRNLVTLCAMHHLVIGHLNQWDCYNPHAKFLAVRMFGRKIGEILPDPEYNRFREERKIDVKNLTGEELAQLRQKLDEKFPPGE